MLMTNTSRLPEEYKTPEAAGDYVKLAKWTTKLRILSKPIMGHLERVEEKWDDGKTKRKPLRYPMDKKPKKSSSADWFKHFWCFVVWNYECDRLQVWEVTQRSIMWFIQALLQDEDYRDVYSYDIKVNKEWDGMETKYSILPGKAAPIDPIIAEEYMTAGIELEKLFEGWHPFPKQ